MNRTIITVAAALLLAGCAGASTDDSEPVEAAPSTTSAEPSPAVPEPTEEAAPVPSGDYDSTCDYLLDFDNGHTFVASAYITNTGEVGFIATVTATWKQADGDHVTAEEEVEVPVGDDEVEVYLSETASTDQISSIQSLDSDRQCEVEVAITDIL